MNRTASVLPQAQATGFELVKKLFNRAQVYDRRFAVILNSRN